MPLKRYWKISVARAKRHSTGKDAVKKEIKVPAKNTETKIKIISKKNTELKVPSRKSTRVLNGLYKKTNTELIVPSRKSNRGLKVQSRNTNRGLKVQSRNTNRGLKVQSRNTNRGLKVPSGISNRGLKVPSGISNRELKVPTKNTKTGIKVPTRNINVDQCFTVSSESERDTRDAREVEPVRVVLELKTECEEYFETEPALNLHSNSKTSMCQQLFKCHNCGESFPSSDDLDTHAQTHDDICIFTCHVCKIQFDHSSSFSKHMITQHNEDKLLGCKDRRMRQCRLCSYTSKRVLDFKKHISMHESNKPFKCNVRNCDNKYTCEEELKQHEVRCGQLYRHKLKCHECLQMFSEYSELQHHMETHTGEKHGDCVTVKVEFKEPMKDIQVNADSETQMLSLLPGLTLQSTEVNAHVSLFSKVDAAYANAIKRRRKRHRYGLKVDTPASISSELIQLQMSDRTDILTRLDLAPPTKKLMQWRETGEHKKLFSLPGHTTRSKTIMKLFKRNLKTRSTVKNNRRHIGWPLAGLQLKTL